MTRVLRTSKLTEADVLGMRQRVLVEQSSTVKMEADRYGLARETVRRALRGETFRAVGNLELEMPLETQAVRAVAPGDEEAEASLNRILAMQKGRVVEDKAKKLLEERGLVDLVQPPAEEGEGEGPHNPLEE